MLKEERHKMALKYVDQYEHLSINQLSEMLDVSKATVLRDVNELNELGKLTKSFGGVSKKKNSILVEDRYVNKSSKNTKLKIQIAKKAAGEINDGDTIILDSGSTTLELAREIKNMKISVFTNDLKIATELCLSKQIDLFFLGGRLIEHQYTFSGAEPYNYLKENEFDKAFFSANSIDFTKGIFSSTFSETIIKNTIIDSAHKTYLLIDHTKTKTKALSCLPCLDRVNNIIMDNEIEYTDFEKEYGKLFKDKLI